MCFLTERIKEKNLKKKRRGTENLRKKSVMKVDPI